MSCLVQGWGVHGREMNRRVFVALEGERSNILILGATGPDEDTGGAVTYMHLHVNPYTVLRRRIPHSCALAKKKKEKLDELLLKNTTTYTHYIHAHTNTHLMTCKNVQYLPYYQRGLLNLVNSL